ncbi:hypothetical protein J7438_00285 [Thalassotalea sp. G20_0]|uniref:hypothetical protein n=1 Tax=Thalassotalea sp. G20_0 TaxID=2821093 RepID=UPI001ADC5519|nr:hypothetical protein [Thalassotalea sp. G20_0]MBO9492536.1 hypothetical protein [Thalassotalea sp. G20_0]
MLGNIAYRDCMQGILYKELAKDGDDITPELSKYLIDEIKKINVKSLEEYSITYINKKLDAITNCQYIPVSLIDDLELPGVLKMMLNGSGLHGLDIQRKINNGLKREFDKDPPNPFHMKVWLDIGAKIDTEVKNKLDSGLKRMIESNNPFFARGWLSLGAMIPDFQQKLNEGLQKATTVTKAKQWCDLGASVDSDVQLKLNEWLKQSLKQKLASDVLDCVAMGATLENLQQQLDGFLSSMLRENRPDPTDAVYLKEAGAKIKPEFQTILDSNLERAAQENSITQFKHWLKLGAKKTDKTRHFINLAAQYYAEDNNTPGVKEWIGLGANNPYSQDNLNAMLQAKLQDNQPNSAAYLLELGAEVYFDIQAELNDGLLRAINEDGRPSLIREWLDMGARLSRRQFCKRVEKADVSSN